MGISFAQFEPDIMNQSNILNRFKFLFLLLVELFFAGKAIGQNYDEEKRLEFSAGLKTAFADITYGKTFYYNTAYGGFALQPTLRVDWNLRLFTLSDYEVNIDLVGQTGIFQYFNATKFDYIGVEPFTGDTVHYISKNPTYLPFYFGFYSPGSFMIGFEMFYYKGIGVQDLYGFKLLSLGYNAPRFRISGAYELYDQVKSDIVIQKEGFLSFDFLWKLTRRE